MPEVPRFGSVRAVPGRRGGAARRLAARGMARALRRGRALSRAVARHAGFRSPHGTVPDRRRPAQPCFAHRPVARRHDLGRPRTTPSGFPPPPPWQVLRARSRRSETAPGGPRKVAVSSETKRPPQASGSPPIRRSSTPAESPRRQAVSGSVVGPVFTAVQAAKFMVEVAQTGCSRREKGDGEGDPVRVWD